MGKCDCQNSVKNHGEIYVCKSILEGTFTRNDGVQFTASMSANGEGVDCVSAKEDSEKNIYRKH